jgi:hypothetical protein
MPLVAALQPARQRAAFSRAIRARIFCGYLLPPPFSAFPRRTITPASRPHAFIRPATPADASAIPVYDAQRHSAMFSAFHTCPRQIERLSHAAQTRSRDCTTPRRR